MSNEIANQNNNLLSGTGTSLGMTAVMTGGFGTLSTAKRFGIKNVPEQIRLNNEIVEGFLDRNNARKDWFGGYAMAENYEALSRAKNSARKLEKKIGKLDKGKLSFWERLRHPIRSFDKNKRQGLIDELKGKANDSKKALFNSNGTLKAQDDLAKKVDLSDCKVVGKTFGQNATSLLKKEFKDPFGIFFAGVEVFTRITSETIPAFQKEGFSAGMKSLGKSLFAGVATWFSDASLSVAFRTAGAAIGSFLGPFGASVGSMVGNAIGGLVSSNIIQKLIPMKTKTAEQETNSMPQGEISPQDMAHTQVQQEGSQAVQEAQGAPQAQNPQDLSAKYANMPTKEQVRQAAYAQAFRGYKPQKISYYS